MAALSVADHLMAEGDTEGAFAVYDRTLSGGRRLTEDERLHANYRRGLLAARAGRPEQAIADLRDGLRIDPLHSDLLRALSDVFADQGRVAAATQHGIQALLLALEGRARGSLCARLGRLWEDRLRQPEEAGVWYDAAVRAGIEERDVMMRALQHYRRAGEYDRAALIIEHLLARSNAPAELATLWSERARLLQVTDENRAVEAYDMALSYDPGCQAAADGLAELLEKRGEWEQLAEMLEARAEGGKAEERARAHRKLAGLARERFSDQARAERHVRAALAAWPVREDFAQLAELLKGVPSRERDCMEAVAGLVQFGEPCVPLMVELGQRQATQGERRWAWSLLSTLLNASFPDAATKATVLELRKELEKSDFTELLRPDLHERLRPAALAPEVAALFTALDKLVPVRRADVFGRAHRVDGRTALGKTLDAVSSRLGLEGVMLERCEELPTAWRVLDDDVPHVLVRGELFAALPPNETRAFLAMVLELGREGARLLLSRSAGDRKHLVEALRIAVGVDEGADTELSAELRRQASADQAAAWKEIILQHDLTPEGVEERIVPAYLELARRVALIVSGEVRAAARLVTRLDESLPRLPSAGKLSDLSEFFAAARPLRELASFALTPLYGDLIGG
jgi:tetratricopeptide (TPR) repeat protein